MIVAIIIVVVLVLLALYVVVSYNGLVSLRNRIEHAWARSTSSSSAATTSSPTWSRP